MLRPDIIIAVKKKLGEVTSFDVGEVANDDLIDSLLDSGVREVLLMAPLHLISPTSYPTMPPGSSDGSFRLELDPLHLRLHSMILSNISKVYNETDVIKPGSPLMINLNYKSKRGSPTKPKLYLMFTEGGRKNIYAYCGGITAANYVKEVVAESLQETLIEPLAWQVAGDTLLVLEDAQSKSCYAKVEQFYKDNS